LKKKIFIIIIIFLILEKDDMKLALNSFNLLLLKSHVETTIFSILKIACFKFPKKKILNNIKVKKLKKNKSGFEYFPDL